MNYITKTYILNTLEQSVVMLRWYSTVTFYKLKFNNVKSNIYFFIKIFVFSDFIYLIIIYNIMNIFHHDITLIDTYRRISYSTIYLTEIPRKSTQIELKNVCNDTNMQSCK